MSVRPSVNVGRFEDATRAMGPGSRCCLWVRGCTIGCAGCVTQEFIPSTPRQSHGIDEVWVWIMEARRVHDIEGVSFSGGEPFEQAEALVMLALRARAEGLSTLAWSGYARKHLESARAPAGSRSLLGAIDALIDGPFVRRLAGEPIPLRGSSNQRIHLLTDRYRAEDLREAAVEAIPDADGSMRVRGVTDYEAFDIALAALGLRS